MGNFDGVHRGHLAVIGAAVGLAGTLSVPCGAVTFEPHPRGVFQPDTPPFRLTSFRTKAHHIETAGIENLYCLHFDRAFAAMSAMEFIDAVLVEGLQARHVVAGYDFVFGKGRTGDTELLAKMGEARGFGFTRIEPVSGEDGEVFSSTGIRDYLIAGEPARAARLLGRFWEIEGRVEHGDKRGRTLGFPTANVMLGEYQQPALGVYAIRAGIDRGEATVWWDGVANIGRRPTFDGRNVQLEAHLFDFAEDIYGRHLRVALVEHLRPEKSFDGLDSLKAQIAEDCTRARTLLAGMHPSS